MLDIKLIRENQSEIVQSLKKRGAKFDLKKLLELDKKRVASAQKRDEARAAQKKVSSVILSKAKDLDSSAAPQNDKLRKLKEEYKKFEAEAGTAEEELNSLILSLPNTVAEDVPAGDESKNIEVRKWGEPKKFDFEAKNHLELGEKLNILDFERGVKTSGSRFYFLKGDGAYLARAIVSFALDKLRHAGFEFMLSPHIVAENMIWGKGLLNQQEIDLNVYKIEGEDKYLIGTGEIPLTGFHAGEMLDGNKLPLKYSTLTPCYRKEAGTYGKFAKGLFRVHQFEKLEMYQYAKVGESDAALDELVAIEESFLQELAIPYRLVLVAAGDMAGYLYKQYDLEYHSPVDGTYREIMSAGNARDFQSRRLNIRYRGDDGKPVYAHTLNATLAAVSRLLIAIIENYQTADGKIIVPEALHPFMNEKTIIDKK